MHASCRHGRPAFTLIEMLVVITIMLALAFLGTAFLPRFLDNQMQTRAVDQLTQWLLTAKQRAKRDGAPTGLRILFDPVTLQATQMQYVQQPEPYTAGVCLKVNPLSNGTASFIADSVDFQGAALHPGQVDKNLGELSPVLSGDYLELNGGGAVYNISGVLDQHTLILSNTQVKLTVPTVNYRVIRQPRIMLGEDVLTLPQDMVIDNSLSNPSDPTSSWSKNIPARSIVGGGGRLSLYEIVFSPTGAVVGQATPSGKIVLWVRNATKPVNDPGAATLVSVQIRTGFIAAHPLNVGSDPYLFTEDGKSSGL